MYTTHNFIVYDNLFQFATRLAELLFIYISQHEQKRYLTIESVNVLVPTCYSRFLLAVKEFLILKWYVDIMELANN